MDISGSDRNFEQKEIDPSEEIKLPDLFFAFRFRYLKELQEFHLTYTNEY